jgi:hypothetical protein
MKDRLMHGISAKAGFVDLRLSSCKGIKSPKQIENIEIRKVEKKPILPFLDENYLISEKYFCIMKSNDRWKDSKMRVYQGQQEL